MTAILWFRRDLRLADNQALVAAVAAGGPVVPVFVWDETCAQLGAAAAWRLGRSVAALAGDLAAAGSRLTLRRGPALAVLQGLVAETGATSLHWTRGYDPAAIARDKAVKAAMRGTASHAGALLFEPWDVMTGESRAYRVFTPFWRAIRGRDCGVVLPRPAEIAAPVAWPASDRLEDWRAGAGTKHGEAVLQHSAATGEVSARGRLQGFLDNKLRNYASSRDRLDLDAGSGLSENLAWGEISVRAVWLAGRRALQEGIPGAEKFLSELAWREFAWHLLYHFPDLASKNWRPDWDRFPWHADNAGAERWRRGTTGVDLVDAGMREMYVTGRMHNRARMVVASYLCKHLLTDWRVGLAHFADCLTDWDPAANALGWQWLAGSGPDAAPYFRVFNPDTQAEKFDPEGNYRRHWLDGAGSEAFLQAAPRSWDCERSGLAPAVTLAEGRNRALSAYAAMAKTVA